MAKKPETAWLADLVRQLTVLAASWAKPKIPSKTLRNALEQLVPGAVRSGRCKGGLYIPHYWALYVHDGRGAFSAPKGHYLVWFRDPRNDPRLANGETPARARDLKYLTKEQFLFWLERNIEAREAGLDPPMIVRRAVLRGTRGSYFFENDGGMFSFARYAQEKVAPFVQARLTDEIRDLLDVRDKATGRF